MKSILMNCLWVIVFLMIISSGNNSIGQAKEKNYFDCNYYHYFSDTAYPKISLADSLLLIKNAVRYGSIRQAIWDNDTFACNLFYLLPVIQNKIDTGWFSFLHTEYKVKFSFNSLKSEDIYAAIANDAVIYGKVLDKRQLKDTTVCLRYKTEYVIEVLDNIHSYFPLKNGDLVLVKDIPGFSGGCTLNNGDTFYEYLPHISDYNKGDKSIFLLNKTTGYQITFLRIAQNTYSTHYDDKYCSQAFELPISNGSYNLQVKDKIKDLKLFFQTKFTTHEYY